MRKNKKLSKGILNSVVTTTVAVTPLAVGAITAVTFAPTSLIVANANDVDTSVNENQSGIDAISDNAGHYTVTSAHTNFKWTDIQENPIIVLKMTNGSYKYKKFEGTVTVDTAKAAKNEFVDAETYKRENGPLSADDKVYIIQETDFTSAPTSIEESYDLTKFHHRENLVLGGDSFFDGATIDDAATDSVLVALARPGSFVSEIEFKNMENPSNPSIYLPKENNTLLVVDNIREAVEQAGDQSYKNFGLFLSHIAVSDDKVNKPNTVMKLPEGVEVIFANSSDQQVTFHDAMNEMMKRLKYDNDAGKVLNPQQKLKFKFIVKKDEQIIQQDKNWREITLHVYNSTDTVKSLVKTTLTNTENNFTKGIVDNIDFSGLPEVMKNEAVEMEIKYPNVDGSTPQDGVLPQFSNPDRKRYDWVNKDDKTSTGDHATSPARYFPYDMDLFSGSGSRITEKLRGYTTELPDYRKPENNPSDAGEILISPSDHDQELIDYYSLGPIFTKTMFTHNFTPEAGGVNESYWNSLVQGIPIPQLDFEPKVNLDIVTLSENTPPAEPQTETNDVPVYGKVTIQYKKADGTELKSSFEDTGETVVGYNRTTRQYRMNGTQKEYTDGTETTVYVPVETTPTYDAAQEGEKPAYIDNAEDGKRYYLIQSTNNETGSVVRGETEVIYTYTPELEDPQTSEGTGRVVIKYYKAGTEESIKSDREDTAETVVTRTTTTRRYYMKNGQRVYVDDRTTTDVVTLPATPYDAAQGDEKPTTIVSDVDGKTYHYVSGADNQIGNVVVGTTNVIYYYAPEEERSFETPTNASVTVRYRIIGTQTDLKAAYVDTPDTLVSKTRTTVKYYQGANGEVEVSRNTVPVEVAEVRYNATETTPVNERPSTLTNALDPNDTTTYHLVESATSGAPSGVLTRNEEVIYYYAPEEIETTTTSTKGKVTIRYKKTNGSELKPNVEDTPETDVVRTTITKKYYMNGDTRVYIEGSEERTDENVAPSYNAAEHPNTENAEKPSTVTIDGTKYYLVGSSNNETGTVREGETFVDYTYAPEQEEVTTTPITGNVIIKYQTEDGTPIKGDYEDTIGVVVANRITRRKYYELADGTKHYLEEERETVEPVAQKPTYTVTGDEEKPTTLSHNGVEYTYSRLADGSKPLDGEIEAGINEIILIYTPAPNNDVPTDPTNPDVPNPPTGGDTTPPTGGDTTPPTGGDTTPPTGGDTTPPTGGDTTPPTGGDTTPPTGGDTTPPTGGDTTPPTGGDTTPPTGGETTPPTGGDTTPPTGGDTTPPTGGETTPPTGGDTTPPTGGDTTPPTGGETTPSDRGGIRRLPQTGDVTSNTSGMAAFMLLLGSALAFFGIGKKKDEKEDE